MPLILLGFADDRAVLREIEFLRDLLFDCRLGWARETSPVEGLAPLASRFLLMSVTEAKILPVSRIDFGAADVVESLFFGAPVDRVGGLPTPARTGGLFISDYFFRASNSCGTMR